MMKTVNLLQPLTLTWLLVMSITLITVNASGQNIGIGTDTPSDKLHIYGGDLRIEDNYPFIFLNKLSTSTNTGINFKENNLSKGFLTYNGLEDVLRMTTDADGLRNDLVITDLGRVCIGTFTSHEFSQLHVSGGDIAISDEGHPFLTLNSLSTNNNAGINMQENGVDKGWFYLDGGYDVLRMSTSTGGSRDDFIMDPLGNIGIGIDIPTAKLHVSGGDFRLDNDFAYLHLNSALSGNSGIKFMENGTNAAWLFYKGDNNTLRFSNHIDGSRTDLTIASDGKVGIGTTNPSNKLHVVGGDVEIQDTYPYLILNDTTANGGKSGLGFRYLGADRAIINYDITNDYFKLSTDDSGIRKDLIIDSQGNIGLGTLSPETRLHVNGGDVQIDDINPFLFLKSTAIDTNFGIAFKEVDTYKGWLFYDGFDNILRMNTSLTGFRNDVVISATGKVGIGTAAPEEALHVEGTIEVNQKIQAHDAGGLDFATDEGTIRMKILDDGNIGVGTTTVASGSRMQISGGDLTVEDEVAFLYTNSTLSTGNSGMAVKQAGTFKGWFHYNHASNVLRITTDASGSRNDLTLNPSGNVGIGTGTQSEKLHVKGSGVAKIRLEGSGSNVLAMEFFDLSTFGGSVGYSMTSDYLFFYHGGNVIVKDGSLGVGQNTIGPGRKIDVSGGAYCSGTNWVNSSDRSLKENLAPVSGQLILEKIQDLDITSWNYLEEGTGTRHIGPMAQDFYSLFGFGYDNSSISTLDADGISFAAIKALADENRELKERMAEMEQRLQVFEGFLSTAAPQSSPTAQH